jgi:CRP/FNR family transcriptional regulator, cyclic AMP receptor protein
MRTVIDRPNASGFGDVAPRDLLWALAPAERDRVIEVGQRRTLPRHSVIYSQGDPPGKTYILERGMVRTFRLSRDGHQFTIGFWRDNDIIGGPDVFSTAPRWLSAETVTDCDLLGFTDRDLDLLIAELPRFAHNLIAALSFKSRWVMNTGDALGTASVEQRVAHVILLQADLHGSVNPEGMRELTHMSHRDIATLVGASRQWVTQTLSALEGRGLIRTGHRRITVLDAERLEELAHL